MLVFLYCDGDCMWWWLYIRGGGGCVYEVVVAVHEGFAAVIQLRIHLEERSSR